MIVKDAFIIDPSAVVNLTADNQLVAVGNLSYIKISSNSATAGSRTFTISAGRQAGHLLFLEFINTATNVADLADDNAAAGTGLRLSGAYAMNANDTLMLLWNGTNWVQLGRSAN